jgi:uncharacterized protein YecE (DUF72 family)
MDDGGEEPMRERQATLFALEAPEVRAAGASAGQQELAARLPAHVRLGTMSWSFPGWRGLVYGEDAPVRALANFGLAAYAQHPLLRAVEIDRSYYEPLGEATLRSYAEQVPGDFRFLVKAHEGCTVRRFPTHARYGSKRGELNPLYLDPAYAIDAVLGPVQNGLGEKLGAILFQFPPSAEPREPEVFASELGEFLLELPRHLPCAVELRSAGWFGSKYVDALVQAGALHCHNAWSAMPPVLAQARLVAPAARNPLVVRWLLRPGEAYADARDRLRPFDRISEEDVAQRTAIARLVAKAATRGVPSLVLINNKAEGCAPESAFRLARAIVEGLAS